MSTRAQRIKNLNDLRRYVKKTLCNENELEIDAFPMTERILVRGGKPCGLLFCLHGPRLVMFSAIWETQHNTVLFYGAAGERLRKIQLSEVPALEMTASAA